MSTEQYQPELDLRDTSPIRNVEEYKFEPIRGYPRLRWNGKRTFTSTYYYPAQHKETYGPEVNGWRNKIYWGDNLQVMAHLLKEYRRKVKLVYIDPPFDSKADYKKTVRLKGKIVNNDQSVFEEKQYTDIWTNDEYLQFMYERLIIIKEILGDDGIIALHCDWRKVHLLRCILDEVFGENNFRGEALVRAGTKNVQSQFDTVSSLAVGHNSILLYSKSTKLRLKKLVHTLEDTEAGKWDTFWRGTDRPTMRYELFGNTPEHGQWRWEKKRTYQASANYQLYLEKYSSSMTLDEYYLQRLEDNNEDLDFVRLNKDGTVQYYVPPRNYKVLSNVWFDLSYRGAVTDYPTEKHEDIIKRLIEWQTDVNDLVFDCFMGSGTTQAVAMKLGRRFLGADINLGAIQTTTSRLLTISSELAAQPQKLIADDDQPTTFYTGFEAYNVNDYDIFRNQLEAKALLIEAMEINPLPSGSLFDGEKDGYMVKVMPVNRIATRQDLNELLTNFDYKAFEKRQAEHPNQPVERVMLVCMGHEPDLATQLQYEMRLSKYKMDVEIVDILHDRQDLHFKRNSEARIVVEDGYLVIKQFYPMNLLQKLSMPQEEMEDWRELVDSVMVDWNYDGAVLQPSVIDVPEKNDLVVGRYRIPDDAGTIRVKITDLLSESLERELPYG